MNKIVPDPPRINLPSDHPLFFYPTDLHERDGNVLAERFERQRAEMAAARRLAEGEREPARKWWLFWRM